MSSFRLDSLSQLPAHMRQFGGSTQTAVPALNKDASSGASKPINQKPRHAWVAPVAMAVFGAASIGALYLGRQHFSHLVFGANQTANETEANVSIGPTPQSQQPSRQTAQNSFRTNIENVNGEKAAQKQPIEGCIQPCEDSLNRFVSIEEALKHKKYDNQTDLYPALDASSSFRKEGTPFAPRHACLLGVAVLALLLWKRTLGRPCFNKAVPFICPNPREERIIAAMSQQDEEKKHVVKDHAHAIPLSANEVLQAFVRDKEALETTRVRQVANSLFGSKPVTVKLSNVSSKQDLRVIALNIYYRAANHPKEDHEGWNQLEMNIHEALQAANAMDQGDPSREKMINILKAAKELIPGHGDRCDMIAHEERSLLEKKPNDMSEEFAKQLIAYVHGKKSRTLGTLA